MHEHLKTINLFVQEENKRKISDAVKCTKEECDRTAAAHLAEVERKHEEEITVLKTRFFISLAKIP